MTSSAANNRFQMIQPYLPLALALLTHLKLCAQVLQDPDRQEAQQVHGGRRGGGKEGEEEVRKEEGQKIGSKIRTHDLTIVSHVLDHCAETSAQEITILQQPAHST